jgi:hypothetical protein
MGSATAVCPSTNDEKNNIITNMCSDAGAFSPSVTNMCIQDEPGPNDDSLALNFIQALGGIGANSEYSSNYSQSALDACKSYGGGGDSATCGCTGNCDKGYIREYQKQANYGDPLMCCLRDFQCNEARNNDINGATCFSDNSGTNTCPQSFRATDTEPCQFLTTQYCLGNIGDTIDPTSDLDFLALWVNNTSELASSTPGGGPDSFKVYSLPNGYNYKLDDNWSGFYTNNNVIQYPKANQIFDPVCELNPNTGLPIGDSKSNSCPRNATITITNPAIPYITDNELNFQSLPPCQSIFWRTLYGNEPKFQNQYWTTDSNQPCPPDLNGNPQAACETSSNAPQGAACGSQPGAGIPTPSGVDWARKTLNTVVGKIKSTYNQSIITPPNLQVNAPFFGWLYNVCASYPYLCKDFLETECSNVTQEILDDSPGARNWCGCYLPSEFYDKYTNDFINVECTPYCNSSSVIPLSQADGTAPQFCEQSVCIIDDVAINLAKTEFEGNGGSINFNQVCGSCGSNYQNSINKTNFSNTGNIQSGSTTTKNGSQSATIAKETSGLNSTLINDVADITCQCRINNFTLTSLGGSFVGGINLAQSCGGNSKCFGSQTDPVTGQTTTSEVDCSNSAAAIDQNVENLKASLAKKAEATSNYWSLLIIFILFAIIIIIWLFFVTRGVPEKDLVFSRNVTAPYVPSRPSINIKQQTYIRR